MVEAEKLGQGHDWRHGANRLRDLLEEWKALPRLDRATDDALWHRFSSARTSYTRARKAHFAELDEKRGAAKQVKLRLIKEAEALATSTEWGPTAGKYRELMRQWKEAGPAAKAEDDELWKRFRGAQDQFFGAREAANTAAGRGVRRQRGEEGGAPGRGGGAGPGRRPRRGQAQVPRHRRALGRRRQGPARADEGPRGPDPQGRAGDPRGRGRPVEAHRPREVRPGRRHGRASSRAPSPTSRPTWRRPRPRGTRRRSRSSRTTSPRAGRSWRWRSGLLRTSGERRRLKAEGLKPRPKPKESSCVRRTEERQRRMRVARLDDHPRRLRPGTGGNANGLPEPRPPPRGGPSRADCNVRGPLVEARNTHTRRWRSSMRLTHSTAYRVTQQAALRLTASPDRHQTPRRSGARTSAPRRGAWGRPSRS